MVLQLRRDVWRVDVLQLVHRLRQQEGARAIGHESISEEHDGCQVFQCHLCGVESCIEAVGRAKGCDDGHGALTVAAIERLQQVGLLALGGQACRRTATLHVDDDQRQLVNDGEVHSLALQTDTRAGGRGGSQRTSEGGADSRCTAADLVLTLHGDDATRLVLRQLVQDVGGRCDGIAAEVEGQPGFLSSGDEAVGRGLVARDIHIAARLLHPRLDAIDISSR